MTAHLLNNYNKISRLKNLCLVLLFILVTFFPTRGLGEDYVPTSHFLHGHPNPNGIPSSCEPIKIALCMGVGYNETVMPNMVGHDGQNEAESLLQTFTPLIQYNCSPQLKLFLCSAYVPMCTDKVPQPIGPCRGFCLQVQRGCEPVLKEFGFSWPTSLDCNLFHPENNHQNMCIPGESPPEPNSPSSSSGPSSSSSSNSWTNSRSGGGGGGGSFSSPGRDEGGGGMSGGGTFSPGGLPPFSSTGGGGGGSYPLDPHHGSVFSSGTGSSSDLSSMMGGGGGGGIGVAEYCGSKVSSRGECWIRCSGGGGGVGTSGGVSGGFFTPNEREHATRYAFIWALLSLILSLIVVMLAMTVARTLSSPAERPILYIGVCQILYSCGVLIGSSYSPCVHDKMTGFDLLAKGSLVTSSCSLVFLLTYFFGIASALWWVSLCLSWLLSLNKNRSNSLETREWSLYHLITWSISSALTCTILLSRSVDSDELTGVCGVGYQNSKNLLYYMLIPTATCLGVGLMFLLTGFSLRLRKKGLDYEYVSPSFMNLQQKKLKEKSKSTWNRVLVISLVHLIPLFTQVGTLSYELSNRKEWEEGKSRPNLQLFLLKINMNLISGFTTGVWILSIYSWRSWLLKMCKLKSHFGCQKQVPSGGTGSSLGGIGGIGGMGGGISGTDHGSGGTNTSFLPRDPLNLHNNHNNTSNPGVRSLPPIPGGVCPLDVDSSQTSRHHYHHHHHHRDGSSYAIRTETWRRGETIV